MDQGAADVFRTVEYSRDRWNMQKVPWALLFCLWGTAFVVYIDPRPPGRAILGAFIFLTLLLLVATLVGFLFEQTTEARSAALRYLAIGLVAALLIAAYLHNPSRFFRYPRGPDVAPNTLGWILIYMGLGWTAFAFYRHFNPARPILALSPAGISFHLSWLRDLQIPWSEVQGVGGLEFEGPGVPFRYPDITVVLVSKEFYEQHILVKRSMLAGRNWHALFRPRGPMMQMVLHYDFFRIDPKQIRDPVEARWKAFHHQEPATPPDAERTMPSAQAPLVYGVWSIDGSLWQAMKFLTPLVGIMAVLVHATVMWRG